MISTFRKGFDTLVKYTLGIFLFILILAIMIKAMCCFDDSAYFTTNRCYDFVLIFFSRECCCNVKKKRLYFRNV